MPMTPQLAVTIFIFMYIHKKTWSQSCRSFHVLRPSHCPECRNEQRWKPHVDVYIIPPPYQRAYCPKPKRAVYNTPCRASPLLCSWHSVWSCEVLTRQNQSVQLRLYLCICIPTLAQSWAFSKDYGCKDSDYFWILYQKREKFSKKVVGRCLVGSKIVITSPLFVQK